MTSRGILSESATAARATRSARFAVVWNRRDLTSPANVSSEIRHAASLASCVVSGFAMMVMKSSAAELTFALAF